MSFHFTILGEHGVNVRDECRNKSSTFGVAPPGPATWRRAQTAQKRTSRRFESPLRKDTALCSVPNVERRPGVFLQHLLQSQLIGGVQRALSAQARGHQLCNLAV